MTDIIPEIKVARIYKEFNDNPVQYNGLDGGRGAAKSHFVAGKFIGECVSGHHRFLCAREYQTSIAESSKLLLEDKIRKYGLSPLFRITEREIVCPSTDSLFMFKGLHGHSVEAVRSIEDVDRFWGEESHTMSQYTLDTLKPSIRASGCQSWFTWNRKTPKDPIDKMFRENDGDPDFRHIHVTYRNNPWFPAGMRRDMERDRRRDPEKYKHIWLGEYQSKSESRVFHNWRIEHFETPADAQFLFGADWGFSVDPTVLVRCFIVEKNEDDRRLYVDYEVYKVGCKIADTPKLFETVPQSKKWIIRADSARPETIEHMKDNGYPRMEGSIKGAGSVEDGIEFLKSYDIIVHPRCVYTADELAYYSYKIDKRTDEVLPVLQDKKNHVIDALRYAVESQRHSRSVKISPEFVKALGLPNGGRSPRRDLYAAQLGGRR